MDSVLDKLLVLSLNKGWQPIGQRTVRQAIVSMSANIDTTLGLDINYDIIDGKYDFDNPTSMTPMSWDKWVELPIRPFDMYIQSVNFKMRVPTVVICADYSQMPVKKLYPTRHRIYDRDKGLCQYTGKKLSKKIATIDHVIPRTKGGKDSWENLVLCERGVNMMKGNKYAHEVGLKLLRRPKSPPLVPVSALITKVRTNDWKHFLINK